MQYWREAMDVRERHRLTKNVVKEPRPEYGNQWEFSVRSEMEAVSLDQDSMRMQSLLICERVLGLAHKDMI